MIIYCYLRATNSTDKKEQFKPCAEMETKKQKENLKDCFFIYCYDKTGNKINELKKLENL